MCAWTPGAVGEAARRGVPLYAVRVDALLPEAGFSAIDTAFADHPDDLLVVGTSGHGWWQALWSGSIARACVGETRCPLLIVHAPPLARDIPRYRRLHPSHDLWRTFEHETTANHG
jgi:nucleotide-binding universal stress UspA family protein